MNIIILGSESKYLNELEGLVKSQTNTCSVQIFPNERLLFHHSMLNEFDVFLLEINTRNFNETFQIVDDLLEKRPSLKIAFFYDYLLPAWLSKINERQVYVVNKNSRNKIGEINKFLAGHTQKIEAKKILTTREEEILQLMADDFIQADIANELGISEKTVRNHLKNIYDKLGVYSRVRAVVRAKELGIIPVNFEISEEC